MASNPADSFPYDGVLPKDATGATDFVASNPEFDGRGIIVAILDTGVDPGAAGLQSTTLGEPKLIDVRDASGSGDVDTSTVRRADDDGTLLGLSGKKLRLGDDWSNPTGDWHVGLKAAYELFPGGLVKRMKSDRSRTWSRAHAVASAEARAKLAQFQADHRGAKQLSRTELLEQAELQARVEVLESAEKDREDPGPVFDCVVWRDGADVWRAVLDRGGDGDLSSEVPLCDYRLERQFTRWDEASQLNFAINVYEEGARLSVVVDSGSHGTHVASIVAAHHPGNPALSGVAPGAQLVSIKIGDGRLDGMETGTAMARAVAAVASAGCDVVNMSFGEPTTTPDRGRIAELMRELVTKRGVIFVSSAGNAGPALSTVGAPGATSNALIGVGAYVEPRMMAGQYPNMRVPSNPAMGYTWTSRGPSQCYMHL